MSKKIGKDVTVVKGSSIIASPKEHEEFQEWLEEQKQERKAEEAEEIEGKQIKSEMPMDKEPSAEQLSKERTEFYEEMVKHKLKKSGAEE